MANEKVKDEDEVVTGEVMERDEFAGFTPEDYRREVYVAREAQRRLQAGVEAMEENRDYWMGRAQRAEAALSEFGQVVQGKVQDLLQPPT